MIKTIALTANEEKEIELTGGCHVSIENRGTGIIYASKSAGVTAGADGVIAIDSGVSKKMKNTASYSEKNGIYDYHGKIYLLSDTDGTAEIETGSYFFDENSGGGGYLVGASGGLGDLKIDYGTISYGDTRYSSNRETITFDTEFTNPPCVVATGIKSDMYSTTDKYTIHISVVSITNTNCIINMKQSTDTSGTYTISGLNWIAIGT